MLFRPFNRFLIAIFLLTGVLIIFCSAGNNDSGCKQFKNGNFTFHLRTKQGDVFFFIHRQDSIQIERDKISGYHSTLSVRWIGDCKYETKLIEGTFPFPDSIQRIRKNIPLETEILKWTKNYYIFKSQRANSPALIDTMWVDKEPANK
jgi:hypothetical protein